jgi:predicted transcriptional regulator
MNRAARYGLTDFVSQNSRDGRYDMDAVRGKLLYSFDPDVRAYLLHRLKPNVRYKRDGDRWSNMRARNFNDNATKQVAHALSGIGISDKTFNAAIHFTRRELGGSGRSALVEIGALAKEVTDEEGKAVVRYSLSRAGELLFKPLAEVAIGFVPRAMKELPGQRSYSMAKLLGPADSALTAYKIVKLIVEAGPMSEADLARRLDRGSDRSVFSRTLLRMSDTGLIDFVSVNGHHKDESKRAYNVYKLKSISELNTPPKELYDVLKGRAKSESGGFVSYGVFLHVMKYINDNPGALIYTDAVSRYVHPVFITKRGEKASKLSLNLNIRKTLWALNDFGVLEQTKPVDGETQSCASANGMTNLFYDLIVKNVERAANLALESMDVPQLTHEAEKAFLENYVAESESVEDGFDSRVERLIRRDTQYSKIGAINKRELLAQLRSYDIKGVTIDSLEDAIGRLRRDGKIVHVGGGCWAAKGASGRMTSS